MRLRYLPLLVLCSASLGAEPAGEPSGDPLPEGAIARLGGLRMRSEAPASTLAFSPDGKSLITARSGPSVAFWDPVKGEEVRRITVKSPGRIWFLRPTADGKTLVVAGDDGSLHIVDAATGTEQPRLDEPERAHVLALDVTRDGKTAAVLRFPGSITVWDLTDGTLRQEWPGLRTGTQSPGDWLVLTPDGKRLVVPHADGSLHLMDVASGKEVLAYEVPPARKGAPPNQLRRAVASPDGHYLACGSFFHPLALFDLKTGKRLREPKDAPQAINGLAFAPEGHTLAVSTYTDIRLYDVRSGEEVRKIAAPSGATGAAVFSPDGRTLASLGGGGNVLDLWDVATGRPFHPPSGHIAPVEAVAFFPDGKRLASATAVGADLAVWDIAAGRPLARFRRAGIYPPTVTVAGDGETVQFIASDRSIHHWDPRTGQDERRLVVPPFDVKAVKTPITVSPDGRDVVLTTYAGGPHATLQEQKKDSPARALPLPANVWAHEIRFAPDGRWLAAGCTDGMVHLWERATAKQVWELKAEKPGRPARLAFAADGRSLAAVGEEVRLLEVTSNGGERLALRPAAPVVAVACSPDSRFLAYGQLDGAVVVCGTATGKQLAYWQGRQGAVHSLAFSRDSRRLATGGHNGTILVWQLPAGELPATLKADHADMLWQELGDAAGPANRALAGLAAAPAQAVPLIKKRILREAERPDAAKVARWVRELDADAFKVREQATRRLAAAGTAAEDALRKALADKPSTEAKKRIEDLLKRLQTNRPSDRLRSLRAIEVLERIGSDGARDVLRQLERKSLPAELREEVQASLRRMGEKP